MQKSSSFFGRIVLAMILMVGFYVLAIGLAATLILLPVAELVFANRIHLKLAVLSVVGGCMILWSVLPRWDRFIAPGPRLLEKDQPDLFRHLQSVAQATQQSMPAEVYALPEMNAWVANRGGIMGIGSRRIMGIGIPLMQVLSTQQFQSVLAHEFGHYYGGDTKLGPWIYVTRSAIIRTVVNFAESGSSVLIKPFEWYLKLFLRLTQKVSRQQEFTADALAAQTMGPQAIASALKVIHSQSPFFQVYWENEYAPVLQRGYQPPMSEGYRDFLAVPEIRSKIDEVLQQAMSQSKSDPYDSHPALQERLLSIAAESGPGMPSIDPPAVQMLRDVPNLEREMIGHMATAIGVSAPERISWQEWIDKSGESMLVPAYQSTLKHVAGEFRGRTLWELTELFGNEQLRSSLIQPQILQQLDPSSISFAASYNLGMFIMLALRKKGWKLVSPVGAKPYAYRDGRKVDPLEWTAAVMKNEKTIEQVQIELEQLEIDDIRADELLA